MGSSTASLRKFEKSVLSFLLLLSAFAMMACAPAEAARVLKANLVNPNGPTSAHNALGSFPSSASGQSFPVTAAEHSAPIQTDVGSEPSTGSAIAATVASEPSTDPVSVPAIAVNGGDGETDDEPDGADFNSPDANSPDANSPAPVPTAWLSPAQITDDLQVPNDHGPFLLETNPMPAVGSDEAAPAGNGHGNVPEIHVALPEEAAPAAAPAGSQVVVPVPDAADSSASAAVPSAWLRSAPVPDRQVPNDHGPYLLGTDPVVPAVGLEEVALAGNEHALLPAVLVPQPQEEAPGDAPAAGSQGVPSTLDGAESIDPVPVPNDHGPYLLGVDPAVPSVGSEEEAPVNDGHAPLPTVLVPQPEEDAPEEAPTAASQDVTPMPDGADSSAPGPIPSAWLRPAHMPTDYPVPNDHGPYLLGTDPIVPAVGSEESLLPVILVPQPEEAAPGETAAGSQVVAPEN
ncbi:unnamed protein product [Closterium sp. Yama58-4]|nr:unnamed protein product [Closterium sp. Yama58-4]